VFFGSTGSLVVNRPIVGMTAVAGGYYLSGSDGGVFTYPTAAGPPFMGSTGSIHLNAPIVGIAGLAAALDRRCGAVRAAGRSRIGAARRPPGNARHGPGCGLRRSCT